MSAWNPCPVPMSRARARSEEHTSELQSHHDLVCRLLLPPLSTLFPYTTLFRSFPHDRLVEAALAQVDVRDAVQAGVHRGEVQGPRAGVGCEDLGRVTRRHERLEPLPGADVQGPREIGRAHV